MDGTVIGLVNGSLLVDPPTGTARFLTSAISSDALWDLLGSADHLEDTLLPKRDGRPLDIRPVDRASRLPPPPTDEQRAMLAQAQKLQEEGWHAKAANVLETLCADAPMWWEPFAQRASVWSSYTDSMWLAGTPLDPEDQITYALWQRDDAHSALTRDPTTLTRHLNFGYALCSLASASHKKACARSVHTFTSRRIPGLRRGDTQASLLALRA